MAHLFQVGAGSGGMVVLDLLARDSAIDRVTLVEPDTYEARNVHRHLFPLSAAGQLKANLAADWLRERRPDLRIDLLICDLLDPHRQAAIEAAIAACDLGVCAVDNEPAKFHFDQLMRVHRKPWTLGEVLSGGIGGWIHRFAPGGACYGCVASHLQRGGPKDAAPGPPPDYANPGGTVVEATVPAAKASIAAIASLHAVVTLQLLAGRPGPDEWTSLLLPLARVDGVFPEAFRPHRLGIAADPACLICSTERTPVGGEELDGALSQALDRLAHE